MGRARGGIQKTADGFVPVVGGRRGVPDFLERERAEAVPPVYARLSEYRVKAQVEDNLAYAALGKEFRESSAKGFLYCKALPENEVEFYVEAYSEDHAYSQFGWACQDLSQRAKIIEITSV